MGFTKSDQAVPVWPKVGKYLGAGLEASLRLWRLRGGFQPRYDEKADMKTRQGFTPVPNWLLDAPLVSAKAVGIYVYLLSRPADWHFRVAEIASHFCGGADSVRAGLDELAGAGLVTWRKDRNRAGRQISEIRVVDADVSADDAEWRDRSENPERKIPNGFPDLYQY